MRITAEPKSDQINAEDFIGSPRTFTIAGVREGTAEQKYDIGLVEESRVWRPPITVLRTLIKCWGDDAAQWQGKRVTLYCDDTVTFGKEAVGGIRVSHVSGIDKPLTLSVTATRGRRKKVTVQPLPDAEPASDRITAEQWQAIVSAAREKGMDAQAVAAEVAGRELSSPRELTAEEGEEILRRINGHAG